MDIGFIGIGQMGKRMCRRMIDAGFALTVHDIDKDTAVHLIEKGAKWADTPEEMAKSCQAVFSCLPTPKDVEQIVYGSHGLKSGWKEGDIFVDMSTNSPTTIQQIARDAGGMGVAVLDAPVSGGTRGADKGTLSIMVGGDPVILEKVREILEAMGQKIFHVGDVGCGNTAKLVNNLISLTINSITAEGLVLGVRAGIDLEVLREVISVSTGNNFCLQRYPDTVFKGNFEPGFKVGLGLKDIGLAIDLGREYGLPLPVATIVQQGLRKAKEEGLTDKDVSSVILSLEDAVGVKVRSPEWGIERD